LAKLRIVLFAAAWAALILATAAHAQIPAKISIVQGNGQLVCDACPNVALPTFDPMVVLVTDANNNPVPNATVNWTVTSSSGIVQGIVASATTTTGSATGASAVLCNLYNTSAPEANGQTCNSYTEGSIATSTSIANAVTASLTNGQSVTFYLTQSPPPFTASGANPGYVSALVTSDSLQPGTTISGPVNSVYSGIPIKVLVQTAAGSPVPNVSVRLYPESGQTGPSISCQPLAGSNADPGSVLTSGNGIAVCQPVFGPTPGSSANNFGLLTGGVPSVQNPANGTVGSIAGAMIPGPFKATATAVTPSNLTIVSGNSQSANAGAALANPLVVEVTDNNNNPLSSQTVTWSLSPSGAGTLNPITSSTGTNGQASTSVTLASTASGTVKVTASVTGLTAVTFSITAIPPTPPITSLSIVSGNSQSTVESMAFSTPLTVMASTSAGAASGVPVQFAITSGTGSLSASGGSATQSVVVPTGSNGQASVTATAGSTAGTLTVTASVSGFSQTETFSLTVLPPPPPISANSFLNGAGFFPTSGTQQTALSPCGVATLVVGSALAPSAYPVIANMFTTPLQQPGNTLIAFQLAGATTTTNAPILNIGTASTSQQLVTFQVPCELAPNSYNVTVTVSGGTPVTVQSVPVRPGAPGIYETLGSDGVRRAIAVRPDGSIVSLSNPARRGEIIRFYITGAGPVLPALASGSLPTPGVPSSPTDPNQVIVGLNNAGVGGVMVQAATELIGVYEVTFQVPNDPTLVGTNNILAVGITALGNPTQYQQPGGSKLPIQ